MHEHVGTAAFDHYQRLYLEPQDFGWGRPPGEPLRELGFAPTLVAAHARHSDLLQIADVVVGSVRDLVSTCISSVEAEETLPDEGYCDANVRRIGARFRRGYDRVLGYGFDVFPPDGTGVPAIRQRFEGLCI